MKQRTTLHGRISGSTVTRVPSKATSFVPTSRDRRARPGRTYTCVLPLRWHLFSVYGPKGGLPSLDTVRVMPAAATPVPQQPHHTDAARYFHFSDTRTDFPRRPTQLTPLPVDAGQGPLPVTPAPVLTLPASIIQLTRTPHRLPAVSAYGRAAPESEPGPAPSDDA